MLTIINPTYCHYLSAQNSGGSTSAHNLNTAYANIPCDKRKKIIAHMSYIAAAASLLFLKDQWQ